jgi:hypothetical protein
MVEESPLFGKGGSCADSPNFDRGVTSWLFEVFGVGPQSIKLKESSPSPLAYQRTIDLAPDMREKLAGCAILVRGCATTIRSRARSSLFFASLGETRPQAGGVREIYARQTLPALRNQAGVATNKPGPAG